MVGLEFLGMPRHMMDGDGAGSGGAGAGGAGAGAGAAGTDGIRTHSRTGVVFFFDLDFVF